jgi:hypothetical protein
MHKRCLCDSFINGRGEKKFDYLKLEVGGLSFRVACCNKRMHPLCLKLCHEMEKLCAMIEKLCTTMERKNPLVECVKNLWNEIGIGLKIELMQWEKKCVKLEV